MKKRYGKTVAFFFDCIRDCSGNPFCFSQKDCSGKPDPLRQAQRRRGECPKNYKFSNSAKRIIPSYVIGGIFEKSTENMFSLTPHNTLIVFANALNIYFLFSHFFIFSFDAILFLVELNYPILLLQ